MSEEHNFWTDAEMKKLSKPFASAPGDFQIFNRPTGLVLIHRTAHVWIVHYEVTGNMKPSFYCAYRAAAHVPKGRDPWAVDNKRIGSQEGVRTLKEAVALCRTAIEDETKRATLQRVLGDVDTL